MKPPDVNQYYLVKLKIDSKGCPHGRVMGGTPMACFILKVPVNSLYFHI